MDRVLKLTEKTAVIGIAVFWCLCAFIGVVWSSPFALVKNGDAVAIVLLPEKPRPGELIAGQELVKYVKNMTGAELRVKHEPGISEKEKIISIGRTVLAGENGLVARSDTLRADSFMVVSLPERDRVYLLGKTDLAIVFSVYHLLKHHFGVRWFYPDELGLVLPRGRDLTLPAADAVVEPDVPMRDVGSRRAPDWSRFNGCNVNVHEEMGVRFYKQGHTFFDFLGPDRYYKRHPEYFSLIRGARKPRQICTSNSEAIQEVAQNISRLIDENPHLDVITLFPQDGLGFCECDRCKALDEPGLPPVEQINSKWPDLGHERHRALSRRLVVFYLSVAEKVLAKHPEIRIQVGAYNPYFFPPVDRLFRAPQKVLIEMCHGWDHNHPIESDASEINVRFRNALSGWREIFEDVSIYEYYRKAAMYDLPFPILHSIEKDISYYRRNGVKAFYTQFSQDYYTNGLNYYIASRLLWDSSLSVRVLLEEFYEKFYQEAREPMREYHMNYEEAAISYGLTLAPPVSDLDRVFTDDLIERQDKLIRKALSLAVDERVRERIRRAGVSLGYVRICMDYIKQAKTVAAGNQVVTGTLRLRSMAEEIRQYRNRHRQRYCFGPDNNYIKRFLNYKWLLGQVARGKHKPVVE